MAVCSWKASPPSPKPMCLSPPRFGAPPRWCRWRLCWNAAPPARIERQEVLPLCTLQSQQQAVPLPLPPSRSGGSQNCLDRTVCRCPDAVPDCLTVSTTAGFSGRCEVRFLWARRRQRWRGRAGEVAGSGATACLASSDNSSVPLPRTPLRPPLQNLCEASKWPEERCPSTCICPSTLSRCASDGQCLVSDAEVALLPMPGHRRAACGVLVRVRCG